MFRDIANICKKRRNEAIFTHHAQLHINPFSPHDALKHHFTSLKTDLIFLQLGVLKQKIP